MLEFDIVGGGGGSTVPDSGNSVLLLGLALTGCALLKHVFRRRSAADATYNIVFIEN